MMWHLQRARLLFPSLAVLALLAQITKAEFCQPLPGPKGACWPSDEAIGTWLSSLSNATSIYAPQLSEDAYLREIVSMNLLKSNYPAAVVVPGNEADLRSALAFASKYRVRVVTRCSGHDFNGRSTGRGVMMIKTERLMSVSYDSSAKTITFGSGCNHADIHGALVPYGRMFVGGQSKTVCPAGCLAGGCHGLLSRQFGLGIDSILEIRFALFNGTVLTLSRTSHAPLFHAYLGAGQNAFGVALSFKAKTYPAPPQLYEINAMFSILDPQSNVTGPAAPNVLSRFFMNVTWWNAMPKGVSGNINVFPGIVIIKWFYTAADYAAGFKAVEPVLKSPFAVKVEDIKTHPNMYELSESIYPSAAELWQRQFITNVFIPPDQALLNGFISAILTTQPTFYMWFVFGGAVTSGTTGSVPAGMRGAMYELLFGAQWHDPADDFANMEAVQRGAEAVYPYCPHSYNNEVTSWGGVFNTVMDWKTRFYKGYDNLVTVKKKYDPCNLFTAQYGVGSDLPTATCGGSGGGGAGGGATTTS